MRKDILQAAFNLGILYRHAAIPLKRALANRGVVVQNYPNVVPGQPYDVELGIAAFTAQVKEAGVLYVSSDFNDNLIYQGRHDNAWFRHVHDMGHMLYQCGFDEAGELELSPLVWQWLATTPAYWTLSEREQRLVAWVYGAETVGQTRYYREHGEFPANQREFVINYVTTAERLHAQA